jgi:hypothetical protein
MSGLYQRLKDLGPEIFEDLCFQIISERHPGAGVTRASGVGGDKGVDIFSGDLAGGPAIWQCKYFVNGIRSPQKRQINKSLRTVLQHFKPRRWILCVPIDLDTNAHAWYQTFRREHSNRCDIGLFQASQIVRELIHRRSIRNTYFPGVVLDTAELRSIFARTGEYSNREIEKLALENVQQYIQRLRDRDARFDYQVTYLPERSLQMDYKGQIVTVTTGDQRLDVFPRDVEAIKLDPPRVQVRLSEPGMTKLKQAVETGVSVAIDPGELSNVRTSFDFLLPEGKVPDGSALVLSPHVDRRRLKFRVTFGTGDQGIAYDLLEFAVVRRGTKEIEIKTVNEPLPFSLSITFPIVKTQATTSKPEGLHFNIRHQFAGRSVQAVKKFNDAMLALKHDGIIEFYDLERGALFFRSEAQVDSKEFPIEVFSEMLSQLYEVSSKTGQDLKIPPDLSREHLEFLPTLIEIVRTGRSELPISGVSTTLVKDSQHAAMFLESLDRRSLIGLDLSSYKLPLLGEEVALGRAAVFLENATIENPEKVRQEYIRAKDGDGIVVRFVPNGKVSIQVLRFLPSPVDGGFPTFPWEARPEEAKTGAT